MIVRKFQPNPLNVFDLRTINHCPPHFFVVDFDIVCQNKKISDWIWENLTGRFYLGDHYQREKKESYMIKRAGFEIHSEASYFALILPDLNRN